MGRRKKDATEEPYVKLMMNGRTVKGQYAKVDPKVFRKILSDHYLTKHQFNQRWTINDKGLVYSIKSVRDVRRKDGRRKQKFITVFLHRWIARKFSDFPFHEHPDGYNVYFKDGDPKNCRLSNLKVTKRSEKHRVSRKNKGSLSRYRGVTYRADREQYQAYAYDGKRRYHLGLFDTEEEAAIHYNLRAQSIEGPRFSPNMIRNWLVDVVDGLSYKVVENNMLKKKPHIKLKDLSHGYTWKLKFVTDGTYMNNLKAGTLDQKVFSGTLTSHEFSERVRFKMRLEDEDEY